jgi:histone arginine demethylase JMJD6
MFEKCSQPCIIEGLLDEWAAAGKWSLEWFAEAHGELQVRCGDDADGERVEMDLQTFRTYCERQTDDVPLYIFDEEFGAEDSPSAELLHDFKIPPYFEEDLFQYLGDERPPFRWLLLGPHRSGSPIHIDPCGTSVLEASSIFNPNPKP